MTSSQVTAQKIAHIMEQPDDGASIEDVCRKAGISIETYYHWYKKYGRPSKARRLRELEDENSRLKLLVAIMSFDKKPMRDVTPASPAAYVGPAPSRAALPAAYEPAPYEPATYEDVPRAAARARSACAPAAHPRARPRQQARRPPRCRTPNPGEKRTPRACAHRRRAA